MVLSYHEWPAVKTPRGVERCKILPDGRAAAQMRQIKRGVFVKKRQKKPPCARGRGGEGAAGGPGRCAAFAFVRRGGFHIRPGRLRRRGVRRDEGIPPYGRPGGWRPFLWAGHIRKVCRGGACPSRGALRHREHPREGHGPPLRPAQMPPPSGWPETQNLFRRGGIYCARRRVSEANRRAAAALGPEIPPAGVCPSAGCAGRCKHRPLQGFVVMRGRGFPVGRGICRAPFIRGQPPCSVYSQARRSRRSLRPGQGPRARGRGPGPGFRPTLIISAHSMRLRNTLQPYSYTPWMSPVACRGVGRAAARTVEPGPAVLAAGPGVDVAQLELVEHAI